jgi:hypothetical protein
MTCVEWARIAAALAVALALGLGCSGTKTCTLIGCVDEMDLRIERADGTPVNLAVSVTADGQAVTCSAPTTGSTATCDGNVMVWSHALQDCNQQASANGAMSVVCVDNGRFAQDITINGTPRAVTVSLLSADGVVVAERTFTPAYRAVQPNGPGCGEICQQASDAWTLP